MNQWSIAIQQIRRNALRSLLMAVGVAFFAAVIVTVTLLMVGINQSLDKTVDRLGADLMLIPRGEEIATQFNEALITGKPTRFFPAFRMVRYRDCGSGRGTWGGSDLCPDVEQCALLCGILLFGGT